MVSDSGLNTRVLNGLDVKFGSIKHNATPENLNDSSDMHVVFLSAQKIDGVMIPASYLIYWLLAFAMKLII